MMKNLSDFLKDWLGFKSAFNSLKDSFAAHTSKVEDFIQAHEINADLQVKVSQLEGELSSASEKVGALEAGIEEKNNRISALESELDAAKADLTKANEERQALVENPDRVVARKAASIISEAGIEPLPAAAEDADKMENRVKSLSGLAKVQAAFEMKSAGRN